jgi:hypothetical protein
MDDQARDPVCESNDGAKSSPRRTTTRRRGNPAMRKGGPSLNPHGRPPVRLALATAVRERFPAARIVQLAENILAGDAPALVKLRTLEFLGRRGYGTAVAPYAATAAAGGELNGEARRREAA